MNQTPVDTRPYQLLCLLCRLPDRPADGWDDPALEALRQAVAEDPDRPLRLGCRTDTAFAWQSTPVADGPGGQRLNEKRDLDILQRLGLAPGDVRSARDLLHRVVKEFTTTEGLCGDAATPGTWQGCPRAASGIYAAQRQAAQAELVPPRSAAEMAEVKQATAEAVLAAGHLYIRPHHLMCVSCFHAGHGDKAPIAEDNLAEVLQAVRDNPDLPVTLVRGCCDVCPPCPAFDPAGRRCHAPAAMALRDQKKDLDVLARLGLDYGDTLPAGELYRRLFANVTTSMQICGYGDAVARAAEWTVCGNVHTGAYEQAREKGLDLPMA